MGIIWNFPLSNSTLCHKYAISPKVFNRSSKAFLLLKDVENRYLGRKLHERSYFSFAIARWKLLEKGNVKFPHSKLYTVSEKTLYHQRYSTYFQELSFWWKMWKIGIWAEIGIWNMGICSYFSFAMARWILFSGGKSEISRFETVHCVIKNDVSPNLLNRFSKTFPSAERCGKYVYGPKRSWTQLF